MKARNQMILHALRSDSARPERVLEVLQDCRLSRDSVLTIISIEAWTTYFVLRWRYTGTGDDPAIDARLQDGLEWHGLDDEGRAYEGGDYGGGGGNSKQWIYNTVFAPALNPAAQHLHLAVDPLLTDGSVTLSISLRR